MANTVEPPVLTVAVVCHYGYHRLCGFGHCRGLRLRRLVGVGSASWRIEGCTELHDKVRVPALWLPERLGQRATQQLSHTTQTEFTPEWAIDLPKLRRPTFRTLVNPKRGKLQHILALTIQKDFCHTPFTPHSRRLFIIRLISRLDISIA
jgi:hypothetical protein